jgi:redox-sensitive bicupin YhaK (pirin superfamily)
MDPHAEWTLPPAAAGSNRTLYFHRGASMHIGAREIPAGQAVRLQGDAPAPIRNGSEETEFLLLQGKPIGEPVAQYGPFVMNAPEEIEQAIRDYQQTRFGGWPWPSDDPAHQAAEGRFARHPDGRMERPG